MEYCEDLRKHLGIPDEIWNRKPDEKEIQKILDQLKIPLSDEIIEMRMKFWKDRMERYSNKKINK